MIYILQHTITHEIMFCFDDKELAEQWSKAVGYTKLITIQIKRKIMKLLYKYPVKNNKGVTIKHIKQVYFINISEHKIKIGANEQGHKLFFWPEGNLSNSVITDKVLHDVIKYHESITESAEIYHIC